MTALGLAAASGPAHAADVLPGAEQPLSDPAGLAAEILEEAVVEEAAVEAVAEAIAVLPAAPSGAAAEEPATTGAAAAPPPEPVVAAAPPEAAADTAPEAAPAAAPQAASEADPQPAAVPETPAPAPDAPPVQQEPTNLNVSVRIDSPGDDGAVTQANVAIVDGAEQYQPEPVRYQPVVPPAEAPAADTPAPAAPAPAPDEETNSAWEWEWTWDCASGTPLEVAPPPDSDSRTWIWNWTWNCGGNTSAPGIDAEESSSGYQAPVVQYRPVNVNVSIRIASPGNNGPVVQTNVAMTLPLPVLPFPAEEEPPAGAPALPESSEPAVAFEVLMFDFGLLDAPAPEAIAAGDENEACCSAPLRRGDLWAAEPPVSRVLSATKHEEPRDITAVELDTAAVARIELRVRRAQQAEAAPPRPQAQPARPAHERQPAPDRRSLVSQGTLGFAPVGAPDRHVTYAIVAFLAFAFSYAFASAVGARGRPSHGVDPDDPPDRPG